eukprot:11358954-Alexandrium_andersonii.AAC.1
MLARPGAPRAVFRVMAVHRLRPLGRCWLQLPMAMARGKGQARAVRLARGGSASSPAAAILAGPSFAAAARGGIPPELHEGQSALQRVRAQSPV